MQLPPVYCTVALLEHCWLFSSRMQYIDEFFYFIRHGRVGGRTISENVRLQLEDASDATSDFPDVGTTRGGRVCKSPQHYPVTLLLGAHNIYILTMSLWSCKSQRSFGSLDRFTVIPQSFPKRLASCPNGSSSSRQRRSSTPSRTS